MEEEENKHQQHAFVYRICPAEEWKDAQSASALTGGQLDLSSGFIHLSTSFQVQDTLERFFAGREDLYLLKINTSKVLLPLVIKQSIIITNSCKRLLGDGLQYDEVEGIGKFPHFYGSAGTFAPLPLSAVESSSKLKLENGKHVLPGSIE